jgi:hypothetical protein
VSGTVTSVGLAAPTGFTVSSSPVTSAGTLSLSYASGYSLPTTTSQTNWDGAYNDRITAASVTGTTTKTITLSQQDGGTVTATFSDLNTDAVSSVFGRTGAVTSTTGDYTTAQVTESGNFYYTDARARAAISITTTGTSGAATYSSTTGSLNIPQYQAVLTNPVTGTGTTNYLSKFASAGTLTNSLLFDNGTNVGIGTTDPSTLLHLRSSTPTLTITSGTTTGTTIGNKGNRLLLLSNSSTVNNGGEIVFGATDASTHRWGAISGGITNNSFSGAVGNILFATKETEAGTTLSERMVITSSGNVGIGSITPNARLEVRGAGSTSATTALDVENSNGTSLLTVRDDGNVGIGTTSPTYKLDVAGTGRFSGVLSADPGITSGYGSIFTGHNSSFQITLNADYSGGQSNTYTPQYAGASSAGMFVMKQRNGGEGTVDVYVKASGTDGSTKSISTFTQILALHTNGNVGIGSVTPAARLEVRGDGNSSTTTALDVENAAGTSLLTVRNDGSVKIGTNGTFFSSIIRATITISASSIGANTTTEFEYTVSGAKEGATVSVSPRDSPTAGLVIAWARVTEPNKIRVAYRNVTSSTVSYSANDFYITIINP